RRPPRGWAPARPGAARRQAERGLRPRGSALRSAPHRGRRRRRGVGGFGARGNGVGGGGLGLGVGGLGTQGEGSGRGGYGSIDLGGRSKDSTRIIPGKTTVVGGLDKDVIARIIRQHQSEIKYCLEVELQKDKELAGKVAVNFLIDGSGAVSVV